MHLIFDTIFGCGHKNTTFPLTPFRRGRTSAAEGRSTYVVCLDCGKEFDYSWQEMRIGGPVAKAYAPPPMAGAEHTSIH